MIAAKSSESAQSASIARREIEMAGRIGALIEAAYPGFMWKVLVDLSSKNKGAAITLPLLIPPHTYNVVPGRFLCTETT
jgi:hypothetical protein